MVRGAHVFAILIKDYLKKKMIESFRQQKEHYKDKIEDLYYRIVDKKGNVYFENSYLKE